jgi:hypothetical protein
VGPACSVTDMWIPLMVLNGPHYRSAHTHLTKQKIKAAPFLLPNVEQSHSILKIWNIAIPFSQIIEPNTTLNMVMISYLFKFMWMISFSMALLMCLCQVFRK